MSMYLSGIRALPISWLKKFPKSFVFRLMLVFCLALFHALRKVSCPMANSLSFFLPQFFSYCAKLPAKTCREILTWNYHKIPIEAFEEKRRRFEKAASIDEYLRDEHKRLVKELERAMKEGRPWFEQEITPEVVEFVRSNQEICTGVRRGDKIYVAKIPYAPKQYFNEQDSTLKRYYACHCQLVRTALRDGKPKISPKFCYCSGGFEKLHFDAIFGEPVSVELLETLLKGDNRCRFAVEIPRSKMK